MPFTITSSMTAYLFPDDEAVGEQAFLDLLKNPGETWIMAYSFTLVPLFNEIKAADAAGVKIHLLLDRSQSVGQSEAGPLKDLANSLKNGDLTVTTAGIYSTNPSDIWHTKSMVVTPVTAGQQMACWEGSVNFSKSGWDQGNTAFLFESDAWAAKVIQLFNEHKAWALANEPQYQVVHPAASHFMYTLPHHSDPASAKGPLVDVAGTVGKVFADHSGSDGKHQQFQVQITKQVSAEGLNGSIVGQLVFVASRYGDGDSQHQTPIPGIVEGAAIEVKGEYIDASHADAGPDNVNPVLPVIHFVHQPYGFVRIGGQTYE